MNAYTTSSTNNTGNMVGLDPRAGDLLRAVGGGGLHALEIVAKSENVFPPSLKGVVADALAIVGITKVCSAAQSDLLHLSNGQK
jgi:hypothetical protein